MGDRQPLPLAARGDLAQGRVNQVRGLFLVPLPRQLQQATVGGEVASGRLVDRLHLLLQSGDRRQLTGTKVHPESHHETERKRGHGTGLSG
jgi:hypothetical protein